MKTRTEKIIAGTIGIVLVIAAFIIMAVSVALALALFTGKSKAQDYNAIATNLFRRGAVDSVTFQRGDGTTNAIDPKTLTNGTHFTMIAIGRSNACAFASYIDWTAGDYGIAPPTKFRLAN